MADEIMESVWKVKSDMSLEWERDPEGMLRRMNAIQRELPGGRVDVFEYLDRERARSGRAPLGPPEGEFDLEKVPQSDDIMDPIWKVKEEMSLEWARDPEGMYRRMDRLYKDLLAEFPDGKIRIDEWLDKERARELGAVP